MSLIKFSIAMWDDKMRAYRKHPWDDCIINTDTICSVTICEPTRMILRMTNGDTWQVSGRPEQLGKVKDLSSKLQKTNLPFQFADELKERYRSTQKGEEDERSR